MENIVEIEYNSQLPAVTKEGLVLVDFYADWCGPCRMLTPIISELAQELTGQVKFVKVNVDVTPILAKEYQVMSVPALVLFKEGVAIESATGFYPKVELMKWLNYHLK